MSLPIIEVQGVRLSFGNQVVLNGVDLEINAGETMVILGGSGSGKSTLLRCMVGLQRPDFGTISIKGTDIFSAEPQVVEELRQRIGMAFQSGALFGSMTVGENVDLPLAEFTRLPSSTRRIVARIKLALVDMEKAIDRYPAELSGGMKKRAAFARAMALDPEILFCDEPSAGLDPVTAAGLDRLLLRLKDVFGITLVVVTHELESAFTVADRIAMIHQGKILIAGTPDEVRGCQDPIVRRFLDREPSEDVNDDHRFRQWMMELEEMSG
jgi:phospholipid/cholesterol/gamma-HCH transport system ATP-binding protein